MILSLGYRPQTMQTLDIGAKKDGSLNALKHDCVSGPAPRRSLPGADHRDVATHRRRRGHVDRAAHSFLNASPRPCPDIEPAGYVSIGHRANRF
jgi:hypothetical protein